MEASVSSDDRSTETVVDASQERLHVLLDAIVVSCAVGVDEARGATTEVHEGIVEEDRPVGRKHVLDAGADGPAASVDFRDSRTDIDRRRAGFRELVPHPGATALGVEQRCIPNNKSNA